MTPSQALRSGYMTPPRSGPSITSTTSLATSSHRSSLAPETRETLTMGCRHFSVTEPHPSVPRPGGYLGGGRGGAGNFRRYKSEDLTSGPSATGPPSRVSLSRSSKRVSSGGRGGAGNVVTTQTEESIFQFDEELMAARDSTVAPVYRIGRGGAGNVFPDAKAPPSLRKTSSETLAVRRDSGMFSIFSRRSSSS